MTGPLLIEFFAFSCLLFLLFVLNGLLVSEGGELFFELGVEILKIDLFVCVDLLIVFGDLEVVVNLDLLLRFWLAWVVVLLAASVA